MKRTFLTAAICLLAACTDGGQQPGAPLNASRNGEAAFEATEGTTVRLEEYLHVTGGVPPYGYATSLQGDFAPSLERTVPAPEHSPAEYGVYVCDSRGNRTESPVVVSLKILPADGERTPAFPGAEGGGRYVTGGRGGRVYYVTNLLDAYPVPPEGSLRWALTQPGPKIVMFKVSGVIPLAAKLHIRNDGRYAGQGCDITVAGETAPGDGICLKNWPLAITYAENVIVRFLRFRLGDDLDTGSAQDACEGQSSSGVILDHCSMSWSVDECASFYRNRDFTLQWCILTESLRLSTHEKESPHGYGGIWGGRDASFHHNLISRHDSRNPRFDAASSYPEAYPAPEWRGNVDFRNNVVYGWGGEVSYGGEGGHFNLVNNYYKEVKSYLQGNSDVDCIYCSWGLEAVGASQAVRELGLQDQIFVVCTDADQVVLEEMRQADSPLTAVVGQYPDRLGSGAVEMAVSAAQGNQVPGEAYAPIILIEKTDPNAWFSAPAIMTVEDAWTTLYPGA